MWNLRIAGDGALDEGVFGEGGGAHRMFVFLGFRNFRLPDGATNFPGFSKIAVALMFIERGS